MNWHLNHRAQQLVDRLLPQADDLRIAVHDLPTGGRVIDCGVDVPGSLQAGLALARICLADLGTVDLVSTDLAGWTWPALQVRTDHPLAACLFSQYAGWQIAVDKFFAMGSGPMRAAAAREELFPQLNYHERPETTVGVLETRQLPGQEIFEHLAERTRVATRATTLLVAPTASLAGTVQVVSRIVETALHKLHELRFDVTRIASALGTAPLSPVAADDLTGIGWTNDAILYGGRVTLWVRGDDRSLEEIGPWVPSLAAPSHGRPFLQLFEEAGRDFYQLDPQLFSPAEVVFQNIETGRVHRFGKIAVDVLSQSFGLT